MPLRPLLSAAITKVNMTRTCDDGDDVDVRHSPLYGMMNYVRRGATKQFHQNLANEFTQHNQQAMDGLPRVFFLNPTLVPYFAKPDGPDSIGSYIWWKSSYAYNGNLEFDRMTTSPEGEATTFMSEHSNWRGGLSSWANRWRSRAHLLHAH